jgi:cytochrome P450
MLHASFEVISRTMLVGGAPDMIASIERRHSQYFEAVNWRIAYRLLGVPAWVPRPGGRLMLAHETALHEVVRAIVRSRAGETEVGHDLLSRLIQSTDPATGQTMSDELVVGNMAAFLVAGYDTTALTLAWTLYLVSQSPGWEERMVEEVVGVAGSAPVTSEHVDRLPVVHQVLNEAMRLYPAAVILVRDIPEDTEIEGVAIRAGTVGLVPIYTVHRHRENWVDPDRFDPGRFGADAPKPSRYKFMPFGAGPRICIGAAFAVTEAVIMIANFVRAARFALAPGSDPRPVGQMLLRPKRELRMTVTMR